MLLSYFKIDYLFYLMFYNISITGDDNHELKNPSEVVPNLSMFANRATLASAVQFTSITKAADDNKAKQARNILDKVRRMTKERGQKVKRDSDGADVDDVTGVDDVATEKDKCKISNPCLEMKNFECITVNGEATCVCSPGFKLSSDEKSCKCQS